MTRNKKVAIFVISVCVLFAGVCGGIVLAKANAQEGQFIKYETPYYMTPLMPRETGSQNYIYNIAGMAQYIFEQSENETKINVSIVGVGQNEVSGSGTVNGQISGLIRTWRNDNNYNISQIEDDSSLTPIFIENTNFSIDIETTINGNINISKISSSKEEIIKNTGGLDEYKVTFYFGTEGTIEIKYKTVSLLAENAIIGNKILGNNENGSDIYNQGYTDGVQSQQNAITEAEQNGYNKGYAAGTAQASNLGNILLGIGGAPVEMITQMLNFELLGINISNLVMSILTAALCVWVIKMFA